LAAGCNPKYFSEVTVPLKVSLELRGDAALITLNSPPVNALGPELREVLLAALLQAFSMPARFVILNGAGKGFSGGADINEFAEGVGGTDLQEVIDACESAPIPVIAAIHGVALGGGLELAMGCHFRVATPGAIVGLPEVKLGVMPGAGGTQRLPRLVGIETAASWMLSGNSVSAEIAARAGLIDALIEGNLMEGAIAFGRKVAELPLVPARDRPRKITSVDAAWFEKQRADIRKKIPHLVSPLKIVDALEFSLTSSLDDGIRKERELFEECRVSPVSRALVYSFFAEREAGKTFGVPAGTSPRSVNQVAIIGAGTMGGGIALTSLKAGFETILIDTSEAALERGLNRIRETYEASISKGRISREKADAELAMLHPGLGLERIADADLIIEAAFERMDIKLDIFRELDRLAKPGAVLATNTSMLDVNRIAAATKRPEDVVGLHFFSPANVMRLLEVVRGARTSAQTLVTAQAVAKRIGKIAVTVGVCDGFVGNRMIEPYFREAEFLAVEGATPAEIDQALTDFGFAMGPFAMSDMAGIDVRWDVQKRRAEQRLPNIRYSNLIEMLGQAGQFGQKGGAGFYRYAPGSRVPLVNPAVGEFILMEAARQGVQRRVISPEEIVQRCLYALVNEGANILEEGIVARAGDIDVIYVNGYGFPAFRGGPMYWADSIGLPKVLADIERLQKKFGPHWQPSGLLRRLAAAVPQATDQTAMALH
jgi:3-hydroxyacyl-CoA dehydrogenase